MSQSLGATNSLYSHWPRRAGTRNSPVFEVALPAARAIFTTRHGGQSHGAFTSLNLGLNTPDDKEAVRQNIDAIKREFGLSSLQLLNQVHGDQLEEIEANDHGTIPIADAAVTVERNVGLLITGADCPTVVLASEHRLAALHCGWRPVASGLIEKVVRAFAGEKFDAAIGPGICQEHFEVGPDVIAAMGAGAESFTQGRQFDLIGAIRHRLEVAGADSVQVIDRCTYCEPDLFFSHRRDGNETGRQAGVAWRI